jgi:hypothetical protein
MSRLLGQPFSMHAKALRMGYAVWYRVVPALKDANEATVQLSVPVIVALGGIALVILSEPRSDGTRLAGSSDDKDRQD